VVRHLGLHDLLLDKLVKGMEMEDLLLKAALCLCRKQLRPRVVG